MTAAQNPCGLLIDGLGLSESQWIDTLEHIRKSNYATVTIMDNFEFARFVKNALPDCVVIFRSSTFEPEPGVNAVPQLRAFLGGIQSQDKRIVIMINCENGFNEKYVDMWSDMIEAVHPMGWRLCVGNPASGSVQCGQENYPNEWLTIGARLLRTLAAHPGHFLGVHEYTAFFAWLVSNVGEWGQPGNKPMSINWKQNQWHIGRNAQGIVNAAAKLGLGDLLNTKFMVITEGLIDQMNDVTHRYPNVKTRGWKQLKEQWENVWFNGISAEDTLANTHIWAWEVVYAPLKFVVGTNTFIFYSHDPQWDDFRVDGAMRFRKRMESYKYYEPVVTPPPAPTDDDDTAPPDDGATVPIMVLSFACSIRCRTSRFLREKLASSVV